MGVWCDSFMKYGSAARIYRWNTIGGALITLDPTGGRQIPVPRGSIQLTSSSVLKALAADADWAVGVAFRAEDLASSDILRLTDGGSNQLQLSMQLDGTLRIVRGGTSLGTSTFALATQTWYHLEWLATIDNAVGTSEIYVNGASVLSVAGDTQSTTNSTANGFVLNCSSGTTSFKFGDLIARYGADAGSAWGDRVVQGLSPDGDGALTAWTPSSGVLLYAMIDESDPSMADFLSSVTPTQRFSVTYPNIGVPTGTIDFVQQTVFADKDDGGVRQIEQFTRIGVLNYDSGVIHSLSGATYYEDQWILNPATGLPWTIAEVNAYEGGVELVA